MKEVSFRSYGFAYKSVVSAVVTGGVKWLHVYCYPVSRAVNLYTKLNDINQFSNLRKPKFETINITRKGGEYFVYTISDFHKCVVLECMERLKVFEREASYKPYITDLSSLLNFHKDKII